MSLQISSLLKPRETQENYNIAFEQTIKNLDAETLFSDIIGLDEQKRTLLDAILSHDPVHHIIIGPPGNGKSTFLKCIEKAFPQQNKFIDSTTSSGIGMIERIFEKGNKLRFLLVDEIEKFNKNDREVFLGLLEGKLTRDLKDSSRDINDLKIWLVAACNDIKLMRKREKPLLDRCDIISVPELSYDTYLNVAGKRLLREKGIDSEEMGKYIAWRAHVELGEEKSMRKAIRLARKSYARATLYNSMITQDVVDEVVVDIKNTMHKFDI